MKQYLVTGMTCAACQTRVEKAVSQVKGVEAVSVSLLTNSMAVEGDVSDAAVIRAVTAAGYGAEVRDSSAVSADEDALTDRETPLLKRRLLWSIGFLMPLLYVSMGHSMFGLPLPNAPFLMGIIQLLLAAVLLCINRKFFVSGMKSVLHGAPNMDTLVALGSSASFLWSVFALIRMFSTKDTAWSQEFYFDSAAMILVLITVGKLLEARSKGKTTDALKSLMRLAPQTAVVLREGAEVEVPIAAVQTGDVFVVKPGTHIPVDGVVLDGDSAVNESALTGESIPVEKTAGSSVSAATVNQSGFLRCRATRVGEDTTLSQIIRMVSEAAATKAPIAKIADRVSGIFVPVVLGIALVTLCVWLLLGHPFEFSLARAISVLVISCPCALGLATPVAIMVGSGVGAKHGVLFKTARALETAGKVQIIALDKTGTVTKGEPVVTALLPAEGVTETELLEIAYALEKKSEHPLAGAVVRAAEQRGLQAAEVKDFHAIHGSGLTAMLDGTELYGGSAAFLASVQILSAEILVQAERLAEQGSTPLLFGRGTQYLGMLGAADIEKEDSAAAVSELQAMGVQVVLLTGDRMQTAQAVGKRAGITQIVAGVLPDGKEAVIRRLQSLGTVAMVGDGINDAPALAAADVGIAIGAGTDVAIDAADVVLMHSRLRDVPAAVRLSRAVIRNIRENLFWAFFYNALCIPLAAGCWYGLFGIVLHPMVGAAAMSLSSLCVVTNALRLNFFAMDSMKRDRRMAKQVDPAALASLLTEINSKTEVQTMTKTMKIEGMMCMHCEAHTKKALEAVEGVASATASHTDGTAVVTLTKPVDDAVLKAAVEAEGYTVLEIIS